MYVKLQPVNSVYTIHVDAYGITRLFVGVGRKSFDVSDMYNEIT